MIVTNTGSPRFRMAAATAALSLLLGIADCRGRQAAAPPLDDAALSQAVQSRIASDTSLAGEPIEPTVQQGVATLNGSVTNEAVRSLAANDAAQVPGIRTVVNNLVIQAPHRSASATLRAVPSARKDKSSSVTSPAPPASTAAQPAEQVASQSQPAPIERSAPRHPTASPAGTPPFLPAGAFRAITLPADTTLPIRISQTIDSATAQQGDTFSGVVASDVLSDGVIVLAEGTPVSGRVAAVQEAAHFKGNALLTIELTSLDRAGDRKGDHLPITTDQFSKTGNGRGKNTGQKIGGGAAIGAVLGGIFGGGRGAAIGAAAGGGAGAGVQAVTRGQQVQIPAESLVRFHLASPITVRVAINVRPHAETDLQPHD